MEGNMSIYPPRIRITWVSFVGSEESLLELLRLSELQRTNSSPISNCRHSKSVILFSQLNKIYTVYPEILVVIKFGDLPEIW